MIAKHLFIAATAVCLTGVRPACAEAPAKPTPMVQAINSALKAPQVPLPNLRRRWVPPKPTVVAVRKTDVAGAFVLKFAEGSHVRLGPDGFVVDEFGRAAAPREDERLNRSGLDLPALRHELLQVNRLVKQYRAAFGFEPSYAFRPDRSRLTPNGFDDRQFVEKFALEQRGNEELADLDLYYVLYAPAFQDAEAEAAFLNALNQSRAVEQVYPAVLAGSPQATTEVSATQAYLGPASSGGIGALLAWSRTGALGSGVRLADVESDWVEDHEDFPPLTARFAGGRPSCAYDAVNSEHGTSVMGIIAAPHNAIGIKGIAPNIEFTESSVCRPFDFVWAGTVGAFTGESVSGRAMNVVVANAIQIAGENLRPGDVLLIEQHVPGPSTGLPCPGNCSQFELVAVEHYQESFDIIRRLASQGIIVVEAAGNGSSNLDSAPYGSRFDPFIRHSGALLVGASMGASGSSTPVSFSNTSRRIDLYSWGQNVATLGFGDGPTAATPFSNPQINRHYTMGFSGTSSASAIVAGAVASLQGARLAFGQVALMPMAMRDVLFDTGTPQFGDTGLSRPIGRQPNLASAIDRIFTAGSFAGPGLYTIRSRATRKVLDVDIAWFAGQNDGQALQAWSFHGGRNQVFDIRDAGGGEFFIRPTHSFKSLDVAGRSLADGAAIQQFHDNGSLSQRFRIQLLGSGHRIVDVASGKAFEIRGGEIEDGTPVVQMAPGGSIAQLFDFVQITDEPR
jgi:serine protease